MLLAAALLGAAVPALTATGEGAAASTPTASERAASLGVRLDGMRVDPDGECGPNLFAGPLPGGATGCTHGPDPAPAGLDARRPVDLTGAVLSAAETTVPCYGDGVSGERVQIVYAGERGGRNDPATFVRAAPALAAGMDQVVSSSAAETGGVRHIRFVTDARCGLDIETVSLSSAAAGDFWTMIDELASLGYDRDDRKYVVFFDTDVYCGLALQYPDDSPRADNPNNTRIGFARIDAGCWTSAVAAHELMHNLGGVQASAPHSTAYGHCDDEYDVMCYRDGPGTTLRVVCADKAADRRLDCNGDDYFHTDPAPGTYLATHWNTADSRWLARIAPSGGPAPPKPEPSGGGGGTGGADGKMSTPGLYVVTRGGSVHALRGAATVGGPGATTGSPVVAGAVTPTGRGYWIVRDNGRVDTFGDAVHHGDARELPLNGGIRAMAANADGSGYYLMGSDGGIFSYGENVPFLGSMGGRPLNGEILDMAAAGGGYWLVGSDGGIFSYGVPFLGSMGGRTLNAPVASLTASADGSGYWLVGADGGIFAYGVAFHGSLPGLDPGLAGVRIRAVADGSSYLILSPEGVVYHFRGGKLVSATAAPMARGDVAVDLMVVP